MIAIFEARVGRYIRAKDENRPHLLDEVFAPQAELEMAVHSDAISFPSRVHGREGIADVLVRQFGRTYENVYTFCVGAPRQEAAQQLWRCGWLVAMTAKDGGGVRVGCGEYEWSIGAPPASLVERLRITIAAMQVLPAAARQDVLEWAASLPYPWCGLEDALAGWPAHEQLTPVREALRSAATPPTPRDGRSSPPPSSDPAP